MLEPNSDIAKLSPGPSSSCLLPSSDPAPSELRLKSSNKCQYRILYRLLSEETLKTRFFILSNKCRTSNFRNRQLFDSNNCHLTNWGVIVSLDITQLLLSYITQLSLDIKQLLKYIHQLLLYIPKLS